MKRLITSMLIVLLISVAFIGSFYKGYYCYAEDINYMSDAELEAAYQAYLQSKGGGFLGNAGARFAYTNGKMLNFLTSEYNTTPFKNINQVKGLMSWEKAELESGNSSVLQLSIRHPEVFSLYTQWLLQNHYFGDGVNDSNGMFVNGVDNNVFSGTSVTLHNYTALVYELNKSFTVAQSVDKENILQFGSPYQFSSDYVIETVGTTFHNFDLYYSDNDTVSKRIFYSHPNNSNVAYGVGTSSSYNTTQGFFTRYDTAGTNISNGNFCIYKLANGNYYIGVYSEQYDTTYKPYSFVPINAVQFGSNTPENVNIFFYTNTNNNIINYPNIDADGTLYIRPKLKINGEYKPYIVNEGDSITNVVNNYYNDSGEKDNTITEPSDSPSGSGGGSGGSGGTGGTPPNWSNPYPNLSPDGSGGFNFNFTLPDLNIDWNINGLAEKFPFSIPFDLIRFVSILNAEPETPHFEGTVNLIVYEWNIDADLSDFDNLAGIVRNVEFIGFCITLILITRKMIKG